jgi:hypothetical protein
VFGGLSGCLAFVRVFGGLSRCLADCQGVWQFAKVFGGLSGCLAFCQGVWRFARVLDLSVFSRGLFVLCAFFGGFVVLYGSGFVGLFLFVGFVRFFGGLLVL